MGSSIDASKLLRPGLLQGVSLLLAGGGAVASAVRSACGELGATVAELSADAAGGEVDLLFVDGAAMFADADSRGRADADADASAPLDERPSSPPRSSLLGCLEGAWEATRAVANSAFIEPGRPGRIVYLAPAPHAGPLADAARAGLENLARTLSIEWARYGITPVTVLPGSDTGERELAALVAYLASPAGAYFSGCLFDLRGPA